MTEATAISFISEALYRALNQVSNPMNQHCSPSNDKFYSVVLTTSVPPVR